MDGIQSQLLQTVKHQTSNAYRAIAGPQLSESDFQARAPSTEVLLTTKGDSLFGLRYMDVYAQADIYRVDTAVGADSGLLTPQELRHEESYRKRTIFADKQIQEAAASFERKCTLQSV